MMKIDIREMVEKEVLKSAAEYKQIEKDRLDFGFDSIYFRYAILCDEVALLKAKESHDYEREHRQAETRKMHFYNCLEQLLRCHGEARLQTVQI